jgi:hypothetical protein
MLRQSGNAATQKSSLQLIARKQLSVAVKASKLHGRPCVLWLKT